MGSFISRSSTRVATAAPSKRPTLPPEALSKAQPSELVHSAEKDADLDSLLAQLHGSISRHSVKVPELNHFNTSNSFGCRTLWVICTVWNPNWSLQVFDEETEKSLAEAKHARKDLREAKLVGRVTTEEFRLLMQTPEMARAGELPKHVVEEIARKNGISETPLWNVLTTSRIPPIVRHSDGYLIGKSWASPRWRPTGIARKQASFWLALVHVQIELLSWGNRLRGDYEMFDVPCGPTRNPIPDVGGTQNKNICMKPSRLLSWLNPSWFFLFWMCGSEI